MRTSFAFAAIAAIGANAVPQYSVQPISQISDGQIQAPPATGAPSSVVVVAPTASVVVPVTSVYTAAPVPSSRAPVVSSGVPVVVPSVSGPVVVPTAPAGVNTTVPIVVSSGAPSFPNSTVAVSSRAGATSGAGSRPTTTGPVPSAGTGAANVNAVNMASFGGLFLALAGLLA